LGILAKFLTCGKLPLTDASACCNAATELVSTGRSLMSNPILVEVLRNGRVESAHRGSIAVIDADGALALARGDIDRRVFPRSANKALQAIPLIETGAADAYNLTDAEIALACASHHGQPEHVQAAASILMKAGRDETTLECGAHWPFAGKAARELAASGAKPSALHNNCSGKHAGFICASCALDEDPANYISPFHPAQIRVRAVMENLTGEKHDPETCGTDGCSIPTYDVPLRSLALAFARYVTGHGMGPERQKAARRIRKAMAAEPLMLSGTGNYDTEMAGIFGERVIAKVGAEGVYCGAIAELGLGVAIKCDDGSMPAAEVMMAAVVEHFLKPSADREAVFLATYTNKTLTNWMGKTVGGVRARPL
jgi:L-asparaginase II